MLQLNSFQYPQLFQPAPQTYHSTPVQTVVQLPSSQLMFASYHRYVVEKAAFRINTSCNGISL